MDRNSNPLAYYIQAEGTIHDMIGADLQGFGGVLRCTVCGHEEPLGNVAPNLRHGWAKHCGYTMRWVTQSQLDEAASHE